MSEESKLYHVYPIGGLKDHVLTKDCWCKPEEKDGVMVHNSMDERESYEEGRKNH